MTAANDCDKDSFINNNGHIIILIIVTLLFLRFSLSTKQMTLECLLLNSVKKMVVLILGVVTSNILSW